MKKPVRILRYTSLFLLASCIINCGPQKVITEPPQDAPKTNEYEQTAKEYGDAAQPDVADFYLSQSVAIYERLGDYDKAVQGYIQAAEYLRKARKFDKAQAKLEKALQLIDNHPVRKQLNLGKELFELAGDFMRDGQLEKAIDNFKKALNIQLRVLGKFNETVGTTYNWLALCYYNLNDKVNGFKYERQSRIVKLRILSRIGEIRRKFALLDKGDISMENHAEIRAKMKQALNNYTKEYEKLDENVAAIYEKMGLLYALEGKYKIAKEKLSESLKIRIDEFGRNSPRLVENYKNLGICLRLEGENYWSRRNLMEALDICLANNLEFKPQATLIYYNLGMLNLSENRLHHALADFQKALIAEIPGFESINIYVNPVVKDVTASEILLKVLTKKAETLRRFFAEGPERWQELVLSLDTYVQVVELIERLRRGYKSEQYKLLFGDENDKIYEAAVATALDLYSNTHENKYIITAFNITEKSKASVLVEALNEARALRFSGIPQSMLREERELKAQLKQYERRLSQLEKERLTRAKVFNPPDELDAANIENLIEAHREIKKRYETLISTFEQRFKKYYDLKYNVEPVTVELLRQTLPEDTALVEYYVGASTLVIFVLTRENLNVYHKEAETDLDYEANAYRIAINKVDELEFRNLNKKLYEKLIKPIEGWIANKSRLVMVPHGVLHSIPFDTLAPVNRKQYDFPEMPFLIHRFAFSYHYSAGLWYSAVTTPVDHKRQMSFVGFAPVCDSANNSEGIWVPQNDADTGGDLHEISGQSGKMKFFDYLPRTRDELRDVIRLFEAKGLPATGFFNEDATETRFKEDRIKKFSIIHIATHAESNKGKKESSLLFYPSNSPDNGFLTTAEVYDLDLDAELIVLSSCESGTGRLALNRGFLYSGARNTIHSLWSVTDRSTKLLMVEMYRNILEGQTYAKALQNAKLSLIRSRRYAFPKFWSPFILVGR